MRRAREVAHERTECEGKGLYFNRDWDDEKGGDRGPLIEREHCYLCDDWTAAILADRAEMREACAKTADEWARDGATEDSKMTGRSIAGRIRSLPVGGE